MTLRWDSYLKLQERILLAFVAVVVKATIFMSVFIILFVKTMSFGTKLFGCHIISISSVKKIVQTPGVQWITKGNNFNPF